MRMCTHRGISGNYSCSKICPEIEYRDKEGHEYCILHAPKYYVQPKGFYYGDSESFNVGSKEANIDLFQQALESLIQSQIQENTIRFDNIYWPKNFINHIDSQVYSDKIFQFIGCSHFSGIGNSKIKSIRFHKDVDLSLEFWNIESNEIMISNEDVKRVLIRDSKIDVITLHTAHFTDLVTITNLTHLSEQGIWGKGLYFKNSIFEKTVKIEKLEFTLGNSDVKIEDSNFGQNLFYLDNRISGWITLKQNNFENSDAYLENIDLTRIGLTRHNLEYLRFSGCQFPDRYPELEKKSLVQAEEVYRDLKKISDERKDYNLVTRWHFLEKEMALQRAKDENKSLNVLFLYLYRALSGYGERPARALCVLGGYVFIVFVFMTVIAILHTGLHKSFDWEILQTFPLSYANFVPLFVTPTQKSLADVLGSSGGLLTIYNLGAALGRIFCIIQVALLSMAIRNHLKR